ncbi:hypothetical protein N7494_009104 [Penicillium frequentans]|uniref:Uncharacterized protein n=1 Tax=Penicillium frequentans TaxID=3151616 RepID=A0AAD6CQ20_9EURO|nr:hypothetical protein N7494_009104 [Penicillium glabrum]
MASEYYTIPLINMLMENNENSPSEETMNAMVLGILNYYFPQSLDYAMDFQPKCRLDKELKVDLAIRRWYPETPAYYQLANQALVDIKLGTGTFGEEDCKEITNRLSVFVDKDYSNDNDCWFILFHGMCVRFYLWKAGDDEDEEDHSVIIYPLEDDEGNETPMEGFHLIEDHEQVDYILRHLSRNGCV